MLVLICGFLLYMMAVNFPACLLMSAKYSKQKITVKYSIVTENFVPLKIRRTCLALLDMILLTESGEKISKDA